jgi:flagellar biogenesis protein FliO
MLKKQTVLILGLLVLCCVGQLLLGRRSHSGSDGPTEAREPNTTKALAGWSVDGFGPEAGKNETQGKLMRQFALAIGFVIILGGCAFYFSKKFAGKLAIGKGKDICIMETIHLGSHKTLHLLEVGGRQKLLIGSTNENVNILADVTEAVSGQAYQENIE